MKLIILTVLAIQSALAYHDPDLNYHLSQVQKAPNCDNGYSYAAPSVQLTTSGIKTVAAPSLLSRPIVAAPAYLPPTTYQSTGYQYSGNAGYQSSANLGYSTGITYQQPPKITYAAQPAINYQASSANYVNSQGYTKEQHGYATSAGLSSASSSARTVIPQATYAQAPIIAKITAAPLIAKFSYSPPKTSYVAQNLYNQQAYTGGSLAKASLNSYNNLQSGGPVVSQVFAAPPTGYTTSAALKIQQAAQIVSPSYYSAPAIPQYRQPPVAVPATNYFAPAVSQSPSQLYTSVSQHGNIAQHSSQVTHHSVPVTQYAPAVVQQHVAPAAVQYPAPIPVSSLAHFTPAQVPAVQYSAAPVKSYAPVVPVSHYSPAQVSVAQSIAAPAKIAVAPHAVKNVHTEFLENYDAHPRYAFEYSVNDPHTGDIKQQKEQRDGEVVKGQYSLVEPDGSVRTVNYVADWETGFHADVRNSKDNQH